MAAVITYSGTRIGVSGPYKSFLGTSTLTVVTFTSGEAPAAADVGRFILWCRDGISDTGPWEIRRITDATATTVTVHDPWGTTPSSGDTFRISSTADDIIAAQPTAGSLIGTNTYKFNGDLNLTSLAFFGAADRSIAWEFAGLNPSMPMSIRTALQLGQLWGGEANGATETTNGCRWELRMTGSGSNSCFSSSDGYDASGPVANFYGSLIECSIGGGYLFTRCRGPVRFVGCLFDGKLGGRFYSSKTEWVDCRMAGSGPAWSLGATFDRAIANVNFFRNDSMLKNYQAFGGTFKDCIFADSNTQGFNLVGTASSTVAFIDCTEFGDSRITDSGAGTLNHYRSINYITTDSSGTAVSGAVVRVNDKNDTTQGVVTTSDGSGVCAEILAKRFAFVNNPPTIAYSPFRIRIRKYQYLYNSLSATVADKIKQSFSLRTDANVTQSSATALAHTGISIVDHGASPVSWNSKSWGITITCDLVTNPSLTLEDLKHYLHYHLAQDATFNGKASGLLWHNLIPMAGTDSENGTYGLTTTKGVRVIDQAGDPFLGVTRMQADDGTYYTPPVAYTVTLSGLIAGTEVRAYLGTDPSTATVIDSTESSGASFVFAHTSPASDGFIVVRKANYKFLRIAITYSSSDVSLTVSQVADPWYLNP